MIRFYAESFPRIGLPGPITPGHRVPLTDSWRALEVKSGRTPPLASVLLPCRAIEGLVWLRRVRHGESVSPEVSDPNSPLIPGGMRLPRTGKG